MYFLTSTYLLKNQVVWTKSPLCIYPVYYLFCTTTPYWKLNLPPKMYWICGIPWPLKILAPQNPVEGLRLPPKMYRICDIPWPLNRLAPQNPVEGLRLPPKMYRILWNFILRFWTRKILNSLRFAQGFALSSAQLEQSADVCDINCTISADNF